MSDDLWVYMLQCLFDALPDRLVKVHQCECGRRGNRWKIKPIGDGRAVCRSAEMHESRMRSNRRRAAHRLLADHRWPQP